MSLLITSSNQRPKSFHEDQRLWDRLVDQIWNGNVIPVIGDNLILEEKTTISDELVKYLSQKYQLESGPENFSESITTAILPTTARVSMRRSLR